jgi:uncharacterized protein YjbI with pentapeptide repeats
MANEEHLKILKQGVEQWNRWRLENVVRPDLFGSTLIGADLSGANLSKAKLRGASLAGADLERANLTSAKLSRADLSDANLSDAKLIRAYLSVANLSRANLSGADLSDAGLAGADLNGANLSKAKLRGAYLADADLQRANLTSADLTNADLSRTVLVETDFTNATITGCRTYGVSAWNVTLVGTAQHNLVITKEGEPIVTVDDLEVGQFIYLILNNTKIRNVIDTITSKAVLILGRFSDPQRKSVLDGLREGLRNFDLLPIVFDFDRPTDKDFTETVQTLAGMSMFVIADLTSPKSTPLELEATVKQFKIPYIPIIDISIDPRPFAMLVDSQKSFHWVLPTVKYESNEDLLDGKNLKTYIIKPALAKREQLREAKNQEPDAILIPKKKLHSGRS